MSGAGKHVPSDVLARQAHDVVVRTFDVDPVRIRRFSYVAIITYSPRRRSMNPEGWDFVTGILPNPAWLGRLKPASAEPAIAKTRTDFSTFRACWAVVIPFKTTI